MCGTIRLSCRVAMMDGPEMTGQTFDVPRVGFMDFDFKQSPAAMWNVYNRRCGEDHHGFYDRKGDHFREGVDPRNYYGRFLPELLDDGKWTSIDDWPELDARCADCGLDYGDLGFADLVVSHDIWNDVISPSHDEGGLLCPTCMVRSAAKAGLTDIPAAFKSGPFAAEQGQE